MIERDVVFISHATPEDNEFAIWIASRLKSLGYSTWVDKLALIGGEKFWQEIDSIIRHKAVKVLLVYSNNICINREPGRLRDGIDKELSLAETIGKQNGLKDFIILLNIDKADYNLFIGADRLNHILFHENWSSGLNVLLEKLSKDDVPRSTSLESKEFGLWYENEYIIKNGIIKKSELYYSSFWRITSIPSQFHLFQFESADNAQAIYLTYKDYPVARVSNYLISFTQNIPLSYVVKDDQLIACKLIEHIVYNTQDVIKRLIQNNHVNNRINASNCLKYLLSRVFHLLMKQCRMRWYELSNKNLAYYHTKTSLTNGYVKFQYPYRSKQKRKYLYGKYKNLGYWHYAVSSRVIFLPIIAFSLKSHIVFTIDGINAWTDKEKMHSHRRSKGKHFFNAEWRDLELAFIHSLCNSKGEISIALNETFILNMPKFPEMFWADFGYFEPKSRERLVLVESSDDDENESGDADE